MLVLDTQWLGLKATGITKFPTDVCNFVNLTRLNLNDNIIPHIPEDITKLSRLTVLFLEWTCTKTLPRTLGNMTRLEQLFLCRNELQYIPPLSKLTRLDCLCKADCGGMLLLILIINAGLTENKISYEPLMLDFGDEEWSADALRGGRGKVQRHVEKLDLYFRFAPQKAVWTMALIHKLKDGNVVSTLPKEVRQCIDTSGENGLSTLPPGAANHSHHGLVFTG